MNSPAETGKEKVGGIVVPEPNLIDLLRPLRIILKEPLAEYFKLFSCCLFTEFVTK